MTCETSVDLVGWEFPIVGGPRDGYRFVVSYSKSRRLLIPDRVEFSLLDFLALNYNVATPNDRGELMVPDGEGMWRPLLEHHAHYELKETPDGPALVFMYVDDGVPLRPYGWKNWGEEEIKASQDKLAAPSPVFAR